ncbi:unnamed protein product [Chrysoparadoxa australica]
MEESEDEEYVYSDMDEPFEGGGDAADDGLSAQQHTGGGSAAHNASSSSMISSASANMNDDTVRMITTAELKELMGEVVSEIAGVMDIPVEAATALLRYFSWNSEKLYDQFYADPESVTTKVGITNAGTGGTTLDTVARTTCRICCDDVPGSDSFALPCAHYFCRECWETYLLTKVQEGPTCIYTACPEHKCPQIVSESIFKEFLPTDAFKRYEQFSLYSFVDINKKLRFCPGKNCTKIGQAPISCPHVKCDCGEVFCFKCGEEAHEPAGCAELTRWKEKCQNESETANWILANTKKCPKCNTRIEKNQGCNHMTCRQCKEEFCWICLGNWAEHGANTGGYYKCNRYDPNAPDGGDTDAAKAKAELDRYLHYYQRYHGHQQSQAYAEKQQDATEKRMIELQESSEGSTWIDVQFLKAATEQLIDCRRVLKYTYVYGYYMEEGTPQKHLFEHHQENLEKFTERLSELSEMKLDVMNRTEVINNTRVTGKFMRSLLDMQENQMDTGETKA